MSVLLCLAECACIVEKTSNIPKMSLSSLMLMMAAWYAQYLLLLCKLSPTVTKNVTSGPVTIHLLSAAGSPVTPIAPPSALTTAFACSRAWSIIIGENCRLDLCTKHFSSERLKLFLLNHIVFVEDRSIWCIIYIVFLQIIMVSVR